MIKQLLLVLLLITAFVNGHAQTDTTVLHPADTTIKRKAAESVIKNKQADTAFKHSGADTIIKQPASITKNKPPDSVVKHIRADTVIMPASSLAKKMPADTVAKHADTGSLMKIPTAKNKPVDSSARHPAQNTAKPTSTDPVAVIHSPIKTLSDERYNMMLKGEDFDNMAVAGELNHYPLPDDALKYKVQIGLNPGQITKLKEIFTGLHRKKLEMGDYMIRNEKMLDSVFHSKRVDDGLIIFYTTRYGLYLGELRNAILQACYKTEAILSDVQIRKLESLEKLK